MIARQRRERQVGKRPRIDPDDLIDFRFWFDHALDVDRIDGGLHPAAGLIGGGTFKDPDSTRGALIDAATELLYGLAHEGNNVAFADITFTAWLHECRRSALAHQQDAAFGIANKRGHHADRVFTHSSSPENSPNCDGSRAGSGKPRCWKASAVSKRPRGVRCRKPFWIRN